MRRLTHVGADGRAQMVDVSAKPLSNRRAVATGKIRLQRETLDLIAKRSNRKGQRLRDRADCRYSSRQTDRAAHSALPHSAARRRQDRHRYVERMAPR